MFPHARRQKGRQIVAVGVGEVRCTFLIVQSRDALQDVAHLCFEVGASQIFQAAMSYTLMPGSNLIHRQIALGVPPIRCPREPAAPAE